MNVCQPSLMCRLLQYDMYIRVLRSVETLCCSLGFLLPLYLVLAGSKCPRWVYEAACGRHIVSACVLPAIVEICQQACIGTSHEKVGKTSNLQPGLVYIIRRAQGSKRRHSPFWVFPPLSCPACTCLEFYAKIVDSARAVLRTRSR